MQLDGVELEQPPAIRPPLLIGTTGPRGIALAADESDGLLLPEGAGPAAVRWASEQLGFGKRLTIYSWLRIDDDEERALSALAPPLAKWHEMRLYAQLANLTPQDADGRPLPARVALAGSAATCTSHAQDLVDAGADEIVLLPVGPDPYTQVQRFMDDVAPLIG